MIHDVFYHISNWYIDVFLMCDSSVYIIQDKKTIILFITDNNCQLFHAVMPIMCSAMSANNILSPRSFKSILSRPMSI